MARIQVVVLVALVLAGCAGTKAVPDTSQAQVDKAIADSGAAMVRLQKVIALRGEQEKLVDQGFTLMHDCANVDPDTWAKNKCTSRKKALLNRNKELADEMKAVQP